VDTIIDQKFDKLANLLRECGSVCVGYSGGVDSVFLSKVAVDVLGPEHVLAVTGMSASYPVIQHEMALECVRRFGIPHLEVGTDELADPNYAANPSNRCYFCKSELWTRLAEVAAERGYAVVLDGSNADDIGDHRPGMQAARERGVRSPLLEAGLTKEEIRELSHRLGLPTWDQPAAPCLASRLPYGLAVTPERLRQVELAETALRGHGLREFRVRHHGDVARLEVAPNELDRALQHAAALDGELRLIGFQRVLLDLEGYRRGSLNETVPLTRRPARSEAADIPELLRGEGLAGVRASSAGKGDEIAALAAPNQPEGALADLAGTLASLAPAIKAFGFRYAALDLAPGREPD
jgi:uncharacterized protein